MDYKYLEQEVTQRKDKLMARNWRGDLSRKGLDKVSFDDLNYVQDEVLNKYNQSKGTNK